jgi:hypothetical protein
MIMHGRTEAMQVLVSQASTHRRSAVCEQLHASYLKTELTTHIRH